MMELLTHNLYRFFGVFVNSPKKEIETNKEKILTSIRENKPISFKLDLERILPPVVERDNESRVNSQYNVIDRESFVFDFFKLFWFISKTPTDKIAFNHLFNGDINSAIDTWEKDRNMSSLQNLFVCNLIKEDYKTAILDCAIPLYEQYINDIDYIKVVANSRDDELTKTNRLINLLVTTLYLYKINKCIDLTTIAKESQNEFFLYCLLQKSLVQKIKKLITDTKNSKLEKGQESEHLLNAAKKLITDSKSILNQWSSKMKDVLGPLCNYQGCAFDVAREVLDCCVDYIKENNGTDSFTKVWPLSEFILSITNSSEIMNYFEKHYGSIKIYKNNPPKEVLRESKDIAILVSEFEKQKNNTYGFTLLEKAQKPLISIKEKLGKEHEFYINTSKILAYSVVEKTDYEQNKKLNHILNDNQWPSKNHLYQYLSCEWKTMEYVNLLDIGPNHAVSQWRTVVYYTSNKVDPDITSRINIDRKFFWSDSEHFASCRSIEDYRKYLSLFPSGNHVAEANTCINNLIEEKRNKDSLKYLIFAILVAIIIFYLIFI